MAQFATLLAVFAILTTATASKRIRGSEVRRLNQDGCTLMISHHLPKHLNALDYILNVEPVYECVTKDGLTYPFILNEEEKQLLGLMVKNNEAISGVSKYRNVAAIMTSDGIMMPKGEAITFDNFSISSTDRKPIVFVGTSYWLGIKVVDNTGLTIPNSTHVMSDKMFGTYGDEVTLASQIDDCSGGLLKIVSTLPPTATEEEASAIRAATVNLGHPMGFMEVHIDLDLKSGPKYNFMKDSIVEKAQEMLGFTLPGPFDHVAISIEDCYKQNGRSCGWSGIAGNGGFIQMYTNQAFSKVGVVIHEYGHNLGMAHSGGLNGGEYSDHTCMMGNPLHSDDIGKMCFNPAKTFYMNTKGWYQEGTSIELYDPAVQEQWTGTLMGVGQWKDHPGAYPVVVKIETGTEDDYYVGFNRAAGANADNDEADDLVTIVKTGKDGLIISNSYLQGYIGAGETFTFPNWQGNDWDLDISVGAINLEGNPSTAVVTISHNGEVSPVASPISPPVTTPTEAPILPPIPQTLSPTTPPTSCTVCSDNESLSMVNKGIDCTETNLVNTKCNKNNQWISSKYCRSSCFNAGNGYADDNCCVPEAPTTAPVAPSPTSSCIQCSNNESPSMVEKEKDCVTASSIEKKCDFANWKKNKFCQLECYHLGKGYDGDICCTTN